MSILKEKEIPIIEVTDDENHQRNVRINPFNSENPIEDEFRQDSERGQDQVVEDVEDDDEDDDEEEDHEGYCLSDEHRRLVRTTSLEYPNRREAICRFALGSIMAFASGLTVTANNFIINATNVDYGELIAVRSILQIPVMLSIVFIKGHSLIPHTMSQKLLTCLVSIFGSLQMLSTITCIKFMPVGDAMALIFTSPLFTIIFAAIFLKHHLSIIKVSAASVLMAGIVLVVKPPFLFPDDLHKKNVSIVVEDFTENYFDPKFFRYSFKAVNWTLQGPAMLEVSLSDNSNGYFIGAIIALAASIFSAANNIIMAKLGRGVPTSVQVFYIGCGAFIVAIVCQFFDENDRFFSKEITEITLSEYGIFVGIAMIGVSGYFCTIRSLSLVPPSTVATLRTSQVIVAFVIQVAVTGIIPGFLDVIGASSIFCAALVITFEGQIIKLFHRLCSCTS